MFFRVLMFAVGVMLLAITGHDVLFEPSLGEIRRQRQAVANWPAVTGEIDRLFFQREHNYARGVGYWYVAANYHYEVDGTRHEGSRFAPTRIRDTGWRTLEDHIVAKGIIARSSIADRIESLEKVPHLTWLEPTPQVTLQLADRSIKVHYDPQDPSFSVLDKTFVEPIGEGRLGFLMGLASIVGLGLIYLAITGGRYFGIRWRDGTAPRASHGPERYLPADLDPEGRYVPEYVDPDGRYEKRRPAPPEIPPLEYPSGQRKVIRATPPRPPSAEEVAAVKASFEAMFVPQNVPQPVISPWTPSFKRRSPDGRYLAKMDDGAELLPGGPFGGTLEVPRGLRLGNCSPSVAWSDDSTLLAVPQWDMANKTQHILLLAQGEQRVGRLRGTFRQLTLESFSGGIVRGHDFGNPVAVSLQDVEWFPINSPPADA